MKKITYTFLIICIACLLASCAGNNSRERGAGTGAAIGAGIGAIAGQLIGGNTQSTIIGTGVGAMVGGITGDQIGAYMDRQENDLRAAFAAERAESNRRLDEARAAAENTSVQRNYDILTATFKSEFLFDYDSYQLKPGAQNEISRVADILKRYDKTFIRIEGHTDETGSAAYNQELSEKRANAVMGALVQTGITDRRISAIGYGKSQPISSDDADNRRVNIVIIPITDAKG